MSMYSKKALATYKAFLEFALVLWEATKPTVVLTDNQSVTRFFQTKVIPPALRNACDYVLQFKFKIGHLVGSANRAADFLSRLELKVTENICLKIREDILTTPIEKTTSSAVVDDEEHFLSPKQTKMTSQNNKLLKEKSKPDKMRSNEYQMKNHPP